MILRAVLFLWIAGWMAMGLLWAWNAESFFGTTASLYFHVPAAIVASVAFLWSTVHSALYLARRRPEHDDQAASAAELGLWFCTAATLSGSVWAKAMWNSYWNWDPRQTSILFLLLIYLAYMALRGALEGEERRARLSAIYSMVAFVAVPFLMYVVPRLYYSLHPDLLNRKEGGGLDPPFMTVFAAMAVGFVALFFWMLAVRVRVARIERLRAVES